MFLSQLRKSNHVCLAFIYPVEEQETLHELTKETREGGIPDSNDADIRTVQEKIK